MTLWSLGNGHFNLLRFLIPPKITQLKHDFVVLFGVKNIYNKIMILLCYLGMEKIHNEIMILLCYLEVKKPQQKHNFVVLFRGKKYTTKSWFHCVFIKKNIFGIMLKGIHIGNSISNFDSVNNNSLRLNACLHIISKPIWPSPIVSHVHYKWMKQPNVHIHLT